MKIVFAQGNPGKEYTYTRHNIGFLCIDNAVQHYDAHFKKNVKFNSEIAETAIGTQKILFVKPHSFYNDTGVIARHFIDFYKCDPASDFLVLHDDLALPFGTIRTRTKGQDAGNNGIKSLTIHLGENYSRIRVGIYNDLRDKMSAMDFVLATLSIDERNKLPYLFDETNRFIDLFIQDGFEHTKVTVGS